MFFYHKTSKLFEECMILAENMYFTCVNKNLAQHPFVATIHHLRYTRGRSRNRAISKFLIFKQIVLPYILDLSLLL